MSELRNRIEKAEQDRLAEEARRLQLEEQNALSRNREILGKVTELLTTREPLVTLEVLASRVANKREEKLARKGKRVGAEHEVRLNEYGGQNFYNDHENLIVNINRTIGGWVLKDAHVLYTRYAGEGSVSKRDVILDEAGGVWQGPFIPAVGAQKDVLGVVVLGDNRRGIINAPWDIHDIFPEDLRDFKPGHPSPEIMGKAVEQILATTEPK